MKCSNCNIKMGTVSKSIVMIKELPFTRKLPINKCQRCGYAVISAETKRIIKKHRSWMLKEHFGHHYRKRARKKDHFKRELSRSRSLLGEAPKGVYIHPTTSEWFLFKEPKLRNDKFTHGFRESVTESLMTNLVSLVTRAARCSLASNQGRWMVMSKIFTKHPQRLVHGSEIFKSLYDDKGIEEIQQDRELQREFYSIQHVEEALSEYCGVHSASVLEDFLMMVLADAWVGNQDRHAENWGLIMTVGDQYGAVKSKPVFSPVFDTARGLFWNDNLVTLDLDYIHGNKLKEYIDNSRPLMSLEGEQATSHFDLANYVKNTHPKTYNRFVQKLHHIDFNKEIELFRGVLSDYRLNLIYRLLIHRKERLVRA